MSNRGKIEFCSTKTVWLLSSNALLAMAFCFSFAKLAFTNLQLSSSWWQNSINSDIAIFGTVVIRKARAASAQRFAQWQHATIETMRRNLSYACSRHIYISIVLRIHPVCGESHIQCNTTGEVATAPILMQVLKSAWKPFPLIALMHAVV